MLVAPYAQGLLVAKQPARGSAQFAERSCAICAQPCTNEHCRISGNRWRPFWCRSCKSAQPLDSHRRYHGHERGRLGSSFQHNRGQLQLVQFLLGALQCHPHVRGHMLNSLAEIQSWMNETQNARTLSVKRAQKVLDKNRADRRWPQLCCCFHCAWPQADQSLAFSISI